MADTAVKKKKPELTTFEKIIAIQGRNIDGFLNSYWEIEVYMGIPAQTIHNKPWLKPPTEDYGGPRFRIRTVIEFYRKPEEQLKQEYFEKVINFTRNNRAQKILETGGVSTTPH